MTRDTSTTEDSSRTDDSRPSLRPWILPAGMALAGAIGSMALVPDPASATHPDNDWKYYTPLSGDAHGWEDGGGKHIHATWNWDQLGERCDPSGPSNRMGRFCHDNVTFELDVVLYDYQDIGCGTAWATSYGSNWYHNMPGGAEAYRDTQSGDPAEEEAFSVGASNAGYLHPRTQYYWQAQVTGGSGVKCNYVKITAQKGHRIIPFIYGDANNVDSDSTHIITYFSEHNSFPGLFYWQECAYFSGGICVA